MYIEIKTLMIEMFSTVFWVQNTAELFSLAIPCQNIECFLGEQEISITNSRLSCHHQIQGTLIAEFFWLARI